MTTARPDERRFAASSALVWGLGATQLVGWGTLYFAFSLFVEPMEAELGWSRADLNGALAAGLLAAGLASIPVGQWIDRHGGHAVMTLGAALGAVLLALWSQVDTVPGFYLIWIGLGLATAATVLDVPFAVVAANVRDYRRGIAYLAFLGGLSSTVFIPLTSVFIGAFGWRHALLGLAVIQLLVPGVVNAFVLRGTRGSRSGEETGAIASDPSPLRRALARPAFWGLAICFSAQTFLFNGITFHIIPLLRERGLDLDSIVIGLTLFGPAQLAARVLLVAGGERVSARVAGRLAMLFFPAAALVLLLAGPLGFAGVLAYVALFGLGNGLFTVVRAAGVVEILGSRGYGAIVGALNLVMVLPRTIAPLALAALWEATGHYDAVIWLLVAVTTVGAAAFWLASTASPLPEEESLPRT
jgi:predicted MFS family arabinose efflux permease